MRKGEKRMRGLRAEGVNNEGPESGEDKGWGERTVVRLKGEEDSNGEDREREGGRLAVSEGGEDSEDIADEGYGGSEDKRRWRRGARIKGEGE